MILGSLMSSFRGDFPLPLDCPLNGYQPRPVRLDQNTKSGGCSRRRGVPTRQTHPAPGWMEPWCDGHTKDFFSC